MECINEALPLARKSVYQAAARFKRGATILLRASEGTVITNNNAVACERVGDLEFHFLAGDFFQNNPFILPLLRITWPNRRVWTGRNSWWTPTAVPACSP